MAITVAFRKQARAWCRNKYGVRWHEDGLNKQRMSEAYAVLLPKTATTAACDLSCMESVAPVACDSSRSAFVAPVACDSSRSGFVAPDVMLVRDPDAGFYVNFEEDTPEPMEKYDGYIGGYHAIALPTVEQLHEDDLSVVLTDKKGANHYRKYTEEDRTKDWAILSKATCKKDLRGLTIVEWGMNTPEEQHEGLITAYGPFRALTEYIAFLQHSFDSHPGYTAHWLDEVPEGSTEGSEIVLLDGRRARIMGEWLLEHIRPRINAVLEERSEYPASVLPDIEE